MPSDFVRFEDLVPPFGLDGADGAYRYAQSECEFFDCADDLSATKRWLVDFERMENTFRPYRRAMELLFNWAWFIERKAVSSLSAADLDSFFDLLADPPGAWLTDSIGRKAPLLKPMTSTSITLMRGAIASMVRWMNCHGYAHLRLSMAGSIDRGLQPVHHIARYRPAPAEPLGLREWHHVCQVIDTQCSLELKATVELMYFCKLKLSELYRVLWSDVRMPSEDFPAWQVVVRRAHVRRILVAEPAAATLQSLALELESVLSSGRTGRIVGPWARETLEKRIAKVIDQAASSALEMGDDESARALASRGIPALSKAYEFHAQRHFREVRACLGLNTFGLLEVPPTSLTLSPALGKGTLLQLHESLRQIWTVVRPGWEGAG